MQLKLAFLEHTEPPPGSQPASPRPTTAWNQLDETARIAALRKLERTGSIDDAIGLLRA